MATPFPFVSGNTLTAAQMNAITTLPINDQTASYVAVVGDVGKRIVMNVATANTVTINNSVFATGDTIFVANKGAGASTLTAGAGVTINSASGLVLVAHQSGQLVALSASSFLFVLSAGPAPAAGLELVSTTTIGTAVSSVTVTGAFSSTYDTYQVRISGGVGSAESTLAMQFGAVTTNYFFSLEVRSFTNTTFTDAGATAASLSSVGYVGANTLHGVIDIANPNLAKVTVVTSAAVRATSGQTGGHMRGFLNDTGQHTAFTLLVASGTITGGTIKVYGYKN